MSDAFSVRDKVCVITGAFHGLGEVIARRLAQHGATVVLGDVRDCSELAAELGGTAVRCDVTDEAQVAAMMQAAVDVHGRIDVLVNNAGVESWEGDITELDVDGWRRDMDVNVLGVALGIKHAVPHMDRGASIINTASLFGLLAIPTLSSYNASKAAVIHLTRTAAVELGPKGIRVNAICPTGLTHDSYLGRVEGVDELARRLARPASPARGRARTRRRLCRARPLSRVGRQPVHQRTGDRGRRRGDRRSVAGARRGRDRSADRVVGRRSVLRGPADLMTPAPPPPHLSDGAAAYLRAPDVLDYPDDWTDPWAVQEFREVTEPLWAGLNDQLDFDYDVVDDVIAGVPVQRITAGATTSDAVVVHLHGGMYCLGSPTIDHVLNAPLARSLGAAVVSVDYRLAPEHPFPAALDDAVAVHRALAADGLRTVLTGESAGGGLAVATAFALDERGDRAPERLALLSPMLDLTGGSDTFRTLAPHDPDYADTSALLSPAAAYAASTPLEHPMLSPVLAEPARLAALPPTLVQVGTREVLLGDSTRFARRVRASGGDVDLDVIDGGWHNATIWYGVPEADAARERMTRFLAGGLA